MKVKLPGRNLSIFALALCVAAVTSARTSRATATRQKADAGASQDSQQSKRPISLDGLLKALRLKGLTPAELAQLIRQRAVAFKLTSEMEAELREAGATPEIVEAARDNYREP